jgi:hypothetical protein
MVYFYLIAEYDRPLKKPPGNAPLPKPVVDCSPSTVDDPTGDQRRDGGSDRQAKQTHNNLVDLLQRAEFNKLYLVTDSFVSVRRREKKSMVSIKSLNKC